MNNNSNNVTNSSLVVNKKTKFLQSKLEDAENKEPEIIERYSEPDDYEDLKYLVKRQEEILSGREEHVSKLEKENC